MTGIKPKELSALILDDHGTMRDLIDTHLRAMGFLEILSTGTAKDAERLIREHHPDIVFVDWVLPGESGYKMMKALREERAFDATAFIMVTGQNDVHHMTEATKAGANSYITKPIIGADFVRSVEATLTWLDRARAKKTGA